jgi:hypothetical protein
MRALLAWFVAWIVLVAMQMVTGGLLLHGMPAAKAGGFGMFALSDALQVLVLVVLARVMVLSGWRRAMALFAVAWGLQVNDLIEAVYFRLPIPRSLLPALFLDTFIVTLVLCLVVAPMAPAAKSQLTCWPADRSPGSWIRRVIVADLLYLALYLSAGVLVWPFVREFYSALTIPPLPAVIAMQILFRGLVMSGLVAVLVGTLSGSRIRVALYTGLALSVLGGVAPLLAPNAFFPDSVRWAHMVETGTSNFLYGVLAALLFASPPRPVLPAAESIENAPSRQSSPS